MTNWLLEITTWDNRSLILKPEKAENSESDILSGKTSTAALKSTFLHRDYVWSE